MAAFKNAMEIFKLLDKSNCRQCGEKTCLAFAGAVFTGRRKLSECPRLDAQVVGRYLSDADTAPAPWIEGLDYMEELKKSVAQCDLSEAALRCGGRFADGKLTVKVFGKDFTVDAQGALYTDIHINPWVVVPFLKYVLYGDGAAPADKWVTFRELKGGPERFALFNKRCIRSLLRVADEYTDLFDDLVHIFGGREVEREFASDISVVLLPLPKIPLMICYWKPEEGFDSNLNVFFDPTADRNLDIDAVFTLGVGFARMLTQIAQRHGAAVDVYP